MKICFLLKRIGIAASLAVAMFCVLTRVQAQTTIFSEGFEGAFPGPWSVGDDNAADGFVFWKDVFDQIFGSPYAHSGQWSGYCAGSAYPPDEVEFSPVYFPNMQAFMTRSVNLAGFSAATLTFWYNIPSIDAGTDALAVTMGGTEIFVTRSSTPGSWRQAVVDVSAYTGGTRTLGFHFFSDFATEGEGAYLDDILLTASGTLAPNLTPFQPPGWSDKIVVASVQGTTTDSATFSAGQILYVDWAIVNDSSVATSSGFTTELYVDDVLRQSFPRATPLAANVYTFLEDFSIGSLSVGTHTIRIKADSGGVVAEANETDNEYTKTITVGGNPDIRISPLTLNFNVTNAPSPSPAPTAEEEQQLTLSEEQKLLAASEIVARLDKGEERVPVIVDLHAPPGKPQGADWDSKSKSQGWRKAVQARQAEVLSVLGQDDFKLRHRFENQSGFSGAVTRKGLEKLAKHPRVALIELSRPVTPDLAQGIPLMNATVYRSIFNGSGVAVAIVDTGVDYSHARLGGAGLPNAKVIGGHDFGDDDPDPYPNSDDAHGTACAGIAAGDTGTVGDYIGGVAPGAKIYALKITDFFGGASDADIIAAWDWCVTHKNDDPNNPILVISTSFSGGRFFSACDSSQTAYTTAANNAVSAGITVLSSSGNNGYCDSMGSPACVSSVISVGAVFDSAYATSASFCIDAASCAPKNPTNNCESGFGTSQSPAGDVVARYSNTASFLGLLAPSHSAYTTDIAGSGGYSSGDYATGFGGTSAACPYAAGAVAALQSAARSILGRFLTPAEVRQKLTSTGNLVTDTKAAITKPRVNLGRAIETMGQFGSFTIFNDGNGTLDVLGITLDSPAAWLSWTPLAPFSIAPGEARIVALSIDSAVVPPGINTRRLLVTSSDADESPYPGGVFVNVTNAITRPVLNARRDGNRIILHWAADASGFVPESVNMLPGANWQTVPGTPVTVGNQKYLTNNITGGDRFYRLRR